MASLTIRNLEDPVKARLRVRAAHNGRSMEEEARVILRETVGVGSRDAQDVFGAGPPKNFLIEAHERFVALGGLDLPKYESDPVRDPPDFSK